MIETLFDFVVSTKYESLSRTVVECAKDRILDYIGCAFSGYEEKSSDIILDLVGSCSNSQEATIIGNGRSSSPYAAFSNGVLGHSKELDDEHKKSVVHLGVVVIPAALALAEPQQSTGKDLITAIVMGYEVAARIGMAVRSQTLLSKGFHPTGVVGVFGSTAAASKILNLDVDTTMSAMGIAGSLASGLFEFVSDGSWTKRLHPGIAGQNGVMAAVLAKKGFTGPRTVINGKFGFANAFSGGLERDKLCSNLGETFEILETSYKRHGCCSFIHPIIDAGLELVTTQRIQSDKISSIRCKIFSEALPVIVDPWMEKGRISNTVEAQFNAFYCLAFSIYKQSPIWRGFTEKDLHNPEILQLATKIEITKEDCFDKLFPEEFPAEVTISLSDGRVFKKSVKTNKGSPGWPLSRKELEFKFLTVSSVKCSPSHCHDILDKVKNLEILESMKDFFSSLA